MPLAWGFSLCGFGRGTFHSLAPRLDRRKAPVAPAVYNDVGLRKEHALVTGPAPEAHIGDAAYQSANLIGG
jgi:hypothetical protein